MAQQKKPALGVYGGLFPTHENGHYKGCQAIRSNNLNRKALIKATQGQGMKEEFYYLKGHQAHGTDPVQKTQPQRRSEAKPSHVAEKRQRALQTKQSALCTPRKQRRSLQGESWRVNQLEQPKGCVSKRRNTKSNRKRIHACEILTEEPPPDAGLLMIAPGHSRDSDVKKAPGDIV